MRQIRKQPTLIFCILIFSLSFSWQDESEEVGKIFQKQQMQIEGEVERLLRDETYVSKLKTKNAEAIREFLLGSLFCGYNGPDSINSPKSEEARRAGFEEGIKHLRKAIELDPNFADAYLALGEALRNKSFLFVKDRYGEQGEKLREESVTMYKKAVEVDPENPEAHYQYGTSVRDPQVRLYELQKVIELNHNHVDALWDLGIFLAGDDQTLADAMKLLRKAIELITVPEIINEKWHNLVGVLSEKGLYKEALEISEVVLAKKMGEHDFVQRMRKEIQTERMWLRGQILAEEDRTLEEGIELMKRAIGQIEKPDFSMGKRWRLADLLRAKGRYREALQWYETLPPMQVVEEIIRDLRKKIEQQKQHH